MDFTYKLDRVILSRETSNYQFTIMREVALLSIMREVASVRIDVGGT